MKVFAQLHHGLKVGGLRWLLSRIAREWTMPTTAAGRRLYSLLRPSRLFTDRSKLEESRHSDVLTAFYDLAIAPVTFDFLWLLVGADVARRRAGLRSVHVVIVPGPVNGLRQERPDYEAVIDAAARRARIANIILPACQFLPSVSGLTVAGTRADADAIRMLAGQWIHPHGYESVMPDYPGPLPYLTAARQEQEDIAVLRAPMHDLRAAEAWLRQCRGRRPVVITLRDYSYMPPRNSNIAAWAAFAAGLDPSRYVPIFVPDTEQCLDGMPVELAPFLVCREAAWNLGFRIALYEKAYVNLGVNNGPMGLCWLNANTRYITFKILSESVPQTTTEYMKLLGFEIGRSLPFATPWQRWVWQDDDADVITRAFAELVAGMDAAGISD